MTMLAHSKKYNNSKFLKSFTEIKEMYTYVFRWEVGLIKIKQFITQIQKGHMQQS